MNSTSAKPKKPAAKKAKPSRVVLPPGTLGSLTQREMMKMAAYHTEDARKAARSEAAKKAAATRAKKKEHDVQSPPNIFRSLVLQPPPTEDARKAARSEAAKKAAATRAKKKEEEEKEDAEKGKRKAEAAKKAAATRAANKKTEASTCLDDYCKGQEFTLFVRENDGIGMCFPIAHDLRHAYRVMEKTLMPTPDNLVKMTRAKLAPGQKSNSLPKSAGPSQRADKE